MDSTFKGFFAFIILLFSLLFCSCQNRTVSTSDYPTSMQSSETEVSNIPLTDTPTPSAILNLPSNTPDHPQPDNPQLDKTLTYRTYQPKDDLTVYISESNEKQQVVIANAIESCVYDWEYNLAFGEPMVKVDRKDNLETEALYIILPTSDTKAILQVEEVTGTAHVVDPTTLKEFAYSDEIESLKDWTSTTYTVLYDSTKETFALAIGPDWVRYYTYPGIELEKEDTYSVVFEDTPHFSDSLFEYRRVGIQLDQEILWLGKFCDDITITDIPSNYLFLPYNDIVYTEANGLSSSNSMTREEQILAGTMITLDPSDALDLNGDGTADMISYRNLRNSSDYDKNGDYSLTVNNTTVKYDGISTSSTLYAGSLDHQTIQLIIFDDGSSADPSLNFYQFTGSDLRYAGSILSYDYTLSDGEITAYCESQHIQCFRVPRKFSFKDGEIKEIELDFYPQGNTVTVLQDVTLYENKDESAFGITLTKGSEVIIVGSDLKEWVFIQDLKSGDCGWLKTTLDYISNCLLPDGRAVPAVELFDGLYFYG